MDLKHIDKSLALLVFATIAVWFYIFATYTPMTLEERQDHYELAKNKECPMVENEEHCRQYYNYIINNLK